MDEIAYSKAIDERFANASDAVKRTIALALCRLAVTRLIPDDPLVGSGLRALEAGRYDDHQLAKQLEEHAYDLDDVYFAAQEEHWAGRADQQTYQKLCAKARAAEAVFCAFDSDPTAAMSNAVYEACSALGVEPVEAEINRIVSRADTPTE